MNALFWHSFTRHKPDNARQLLTRLRPTFHPFLRSLLPGFTSRVANQAPGFQGRASSKPGGRTRTHKGHPSRVAISNSRVSMRFAKVELASSNNEARRPEISGGRLASGYGSPLAHIYKAIRSPIQRY